MKLEYRVNTGIFLAPKSYMIQTVEKGEILKHKGAGKSYVDQKWYESQYQDVRSNIREEVDIENWFSEKPGYFEKENDPKRTNVYDVNDIWVGTKPKVVIDSSHNVFNTRVIDGLVEREGDPRYDYEDTYPINSIAALLYEITTNSYFLTDSEEVINMGREGSESEGCTDSDG